MPPRWPAPECGLAVSMRLTRSLSHRRGLAFGSRAPSQDSRLYRATGAIVTTGGTATWLCSRQKNTVACEEPAKDQPDQSRKDDPSLLQKLGSSVPSLPDLPSLEFPSFNMPSLPHIDFVSVLRDWGRTLSDFRDRMTVCNQQRIFASVR